jgi:hypothetical protein
VSTSREVQRSAQRVDEPGPRRRGVTAGTVVLATEIPGATLLTLPGIGQGVPRVTWPAVVDALLHHTSDTPRRT